MSIYASCLNNLLKNTRKYRDGELDIEEYKKVIWNTACGIVSLEGKELRQFLQEAEAEIDSLYFTVDEGNIFAKSLKIVDKIENRISLALSNLFTNS